jgi:hypothetical protein
MAYLADAMPPHALPASAHMLRMSFTALMIARAAYVAAKLGISALLQ